MGLPGSYYDQMRADYLLKRELLVDTLRGVGFEPYLPEGSYYLLASFERGRWANATAATEAILEEVGVAAVPGSAFYRNPADGENQLRFCYAKQMPDLVDACARLAKLSTRCEKISGGTGGKG
jgi:aminotransferase